jgi:flagellar biosynthesis protein FlhG
MADQAERLRQIVQKGTDRSDGPTRVIAVTSGKGGVGKTNFAVNVGIALSQLGQRVLLVDADLGLANADMVLGVTPKFHLGHVLSEQKEAWEVILTGPAGLRILAGGAGDYRLANLSERSLENCLRHLNAIEKELDIIIIDTGAGISRNVLKFVLAAGEVIIVTTPEPTAITDAYGVIKVVTSAEPNLPLRVVVNMTRNQSEGQQVVERLMTVSQRFLGVTLATVGFISWDQTVSKAVKEQQPFVIGHPHSTAARDIGLIAQNIINHADVDEQQDAKNFFERLFAKFR